MPGKDATTSALHKKGKVKILQILKFQDMKNVASAFGGLEATPSGIGSCGTKIMLKMYSGKKTDTLGSLRYAKYVSMVATAKNMQPQMLPPTERATYFHSLRVHLQVAQWKNLELN